MEAWLKKLGVGAVNAGVFDGTWRGAVVESVSPVDGKVIARVRDRTQIIAEVLSSGAAGRVLRALSARQSVRRRPHGRAAVAC